MYTCFENQKKINTKGQNTNKKTEKTNQKPKIEQANKKTLKRYCSGEYLNVYLQPLRGRKLFINQYKN